jgi:site-specific recombinase XerD
LAFLNADGRPLDPKYVNSQLKSILRSAGLPVVSMHKLRHTVATVALGKGIPLTVVRDFMGHSQIALTANTYSHAVPKALRDVADMLDL